MNILAIDTSSLNASCAVLCSGVLTGEFSICNKKTHSQMLMPMLDDVLKKASMSIEDIDIFAPCIGPGSFTGLRIGIAAAKALCQARGKKIIGISALDSLAQNIAFSDKIVCPIMDARRGDVYNALYKNGEKITSERAVSLEELLSELDGKETIFTGDGVFAYREKIAEKMGKFAYFAPPMHMLSRASSIAYLAEKKAENGEFDDYHTILPVYLRTCQAEREYNERMKEFKTN